MFVTMEQVKRGTTAYYEQEFCQKADNIGKFLAYMLLPSIPAKVERETAKLRPMLTEEGMMNADGLVELDELRNRAEDAMRHCGNIEVMGFRLGEEDVNRLYDSIRQA